ncbi:MAG: 4-hydroxy-tetrahydrodipicolinate synthase [Puniceicoccales bacterium]|jgi:4-hydroxy-tetrahydrodipicolinate synthase|nr:4-hydroxy-tetrahydrodipicolinate synthase [Puniceicoccales bacterium]
MLECGVYTAVVTPFEGDKLSCECLKGLIDFQVEAGVRGVVVCGTTGEAPTLSHGEYENVLRCAVECAAGKIKVFAGVGSFDTKQAVSKTKLAHELGLDGMLAVTPYYNKPTQNGLVEYFCRIANSTDKPIILYSVPSRCAVEIAVDTVKTLAGKCKNICAIKEATDSCARVDAIREATSGDFVILSGNDSVTIPFMSLGASGVVSVASNLLPREMVAMVECARSGDYASALAKYREIYPVISKLFIETNPLPIKYLLHKRGSIKSSECRSPLGKLSEKSTAELDKLL